MSASAAAFAGAAGAGYAIIVTISNQTVGPEFSVSASSAGIKLTRGGQYQTGSSGVSVTPTFSDVGGSEWADRESATVGDSFEAMLETTTGTLSSGTADSWLALTSDRTWYVSQNGAGTKTFTGTLKIRRGGVVQDTATISLTATVESV